MEKKYALILSGGAARGAYEVGVLKYIFQEMPRIYGKLPKFQIICGTSVGAIHACFLAAHLPKISSDIERLEKIWTNLSPSKVVTLDVGQLFRIKELLLGGKRGVGLLNVNPLAILLGKEGAYDQITKTIQSGELETLCVSTTSARTGKTVVFTESNSTLPAPIFRTEFRAAHISLQHALASASLPILFAPIQIGGEWFTDGGVRQNTPMVPALGFGATHTLSIGMWHDRKFNPSNAIDDSPSIGCLVGKIFNSFFIDHAHVDVHSLEHINNVIAEGVKKFGPEFAAHLAKQERPYKYINSCSISPSMDLGRIAANYLSSDDVKKNKIYRNLLRLIDIGTIEADLASYLLFDGGFAEMLIELGFEDAQARQKELAQFFGLEETDI